jgi:hypothetical protein
MKFLLILLLQGTVQSGVQNDVAVLRRFLGADFANAMKLLAPANDFLIGNVQGNSPQQAARMRADIALPATLPEKQNIVQLTVTNAGRGIVTTLFEEDFMTEQVNLVFCPAAPRRVVAVQVLFDDRPALRDTLFLLQRIYQMPQPSKFETYQPAMKYDLAGVSYDAESRWKKTATAPAVTVFDLGTAAEAIYQPVVGQRLITSQLWVGDKNAAKTCPVPITTKA